MIQVSRYMFFCKRASSALVATDRRPCWPRCASVQPWRRWGAALETIFIQFC